MTSVVIEKRFCGPPNSGNGGYVCGLLAAHIEADAEVTLLAPPPLCCSPQRRDTAPARAAASRARRRRS